MAPAGISLWPPCAHTEICEDCLGTSRTTCALEDRGPGQPETSPGSSMASTALTWRTLLPSTRRTYRAKPGSPRDTHPSAGDTGHADGQGGGQPGKALPHPAHSGQGVTPKAPWRVPHHTGPVQMEKGQVCLSSRTRVEAAVHSVLGDCAAWPLGPRLGAAMAARGGESVPSAPAPFSLKARCTHFQRAWSVP